jgi:two-component system CheB/CheR fusion protein
MMRSRLKARVGLIRTDESEISPERLRHHFTREDHGYRIGKSIRDMCVARQNVAADPPFSAWT